MKYNTIYTVKIIVCNIDHIRVKQTIARVKVISRHLLAQVCENNEWALDANGMKMSDDCVWLWTIGCLLWYDCEWIYTCI